jgi:hypothetical protein
VCCIIILLISDKFSSLLLLRLAGRIERTVDRCLRSRRWRRGMRTLFDLLSDRNTRRLCWRFAAGKEKSDCESSNQQDESHSGIFRTTSTKFTKNISSSVCKIDGMQADWASSPWNCAKANLRRKRGDAGELPCNFGKWSDVQVSL